MKLMLDTNIFNSVCDGKIKLNIFEGHQLCSTHVQSDELNETKDESRRKKLLEVFTFTDTKRMNTESAVWGASSWGEANWTSDTQKFDEMLATLRVLDKKSMKKPRIHNQNRDILIAQTAIENGIVLVTDDGNLREVCEAFGGQAWSIERLRTQ